MEHVLIVIQVANLVMVYLIQIVLHVKHSIICKMNRTHHVIKILFKIEIIIAKLEKEIFAQ